MGFRDWGLGPVLGRASEESFSNTLGLFSNTGILSAGRNRICTTLLMLSFT